MRAFFENRKDKGDSGFAAGEVCDISFFAHWHNEIELLYVSEGTIGVGINREYRVLQAGDMAVCEGNSIHYYNSIGENAMAYMLIFPYDMLSFKALGIKAKIASAFFEGDAGFDTDCLIKAKIESIVNENRGDEVFKTQMINVLLSDLFLSLFRTQKSYMNLCKGKAKLENKQLSAEPMQRALQYIQENFVEEITLESTAQEAGLSPYYFSRLFKKTTGTNYNVYLSQVRVDNAAHLIETTDENIIDIAFKSGFKSIRTFNRVFKSLTGMTPNKMRED